MRIATILSTLLITLSFYSNAQEVEPDLYSSLVPRCIGPAGVSGRVTSLAVDPNNHDVFYIGTATGGLWKTESDGVGWVSLFDEQNCSSIGAIALDPRNPNVIWVGTGEANPRNSSGVGKGVYKSIDGGKTWKHLGLEKTEKISRLLIDPNHPRTAYVAALGTTWGENEERGVFKTTDGGKKWKKVLFVDNKTGAADLAMDPSNPNRLICNMWEHRRWPWFFKSGGPGSGIYTTGDGGENWKKLGEDEGMPKGELGRAGISFCQDHPEVVYILLEAEKSVMLKSQDGGYIFKKVTDQTGINPRPFYFGDIRVHPQDPNTVYRLQTNLDISTDGGQSFKGLFTWTHVHPDHHALWISGDGMKMIDGNDGGLAISKDGGKTWRFVYNLALAQFYHIAVDNRFPYNVYGGMQDNGSMRGPSTTFISDGIFNDDWEGVSFGDGFATLPDPENEDFGYSMSQGGSLMYFNYKTGVKKDIRPTETDVKHRYAWNAAIAQDPFDKATIYYGSQFVHKSTDRGNSWKIISPDLTTNDPEKLKQAESGGLTRDVTAAENHCTIITISPSKKKKDLIWAGSDDGNIQVTEDGGKSWRNAAETLRKRHGVPEGAWVSHIETSSHDANTAFVTIDDHRRSNWKTYVFKTTDLGKTWIDISNPDIDGFCHVIRQDHVDPELLFLGAEFGLYSSTDGGRNWKKWGKTMPTVPIRDLVIHPTQHDLVIGTHGRAMWIVDDISPLRNLDHKAMTEEVKLLPVQDAYMYHSSRWGGSFWSPGENQFIGKRRANGALINYIVPKKIAEAEDDSLKKDLKFVYILDQDSTMIKKIEATTEPGLNRVVWNCKHGAWKSPISAGQRDSDGKGSSVSVVPGTYLVKYNNQYQKVNVFADPRIATTQEGLQARFDLQQKCGALMEALGAANKQIVDMKKIVDRINAAVEVDSAGNSEISKMGSEIKDSLENLGSRIRYDGNQQGIYDRSAPLTSKLWGALGIVNSAYEAPTEPALKRYENVEKLVQELITELNSFFSNDVKKYRDAVKSSGLKLVPEYDKIELPKN